MRRRVRDRPKRKPLPPVVKRMIKTDDGDEEPKVDDSKLHEIWRVCRKIQATIFRYNFDICGDFLPYDPECTGLISEPLFTSILGKYKNVVPFSELELIEITDYFRLRDGRVAYKQFCKAVCDDQTPGACKNLITGLEWNDPLHVNVIPKPADRRRLCLLLIKIAQSLHMPLNPYFQDYEMVSNNIGVVTIPHFSRVLQFMKIPMSDEEFLLLLQRYMKDAFTVNYVAFLKHLHNIIDYFKGEKLLDLSLEMIKNFPGRLVELEMSELPAISGKRMAFKAFPDLCNHPKKNKDVCDIIFCIQSFVHEKRVRVRQFLECFDHLNTGTITKNQFERALDSIGVHEFLSQRDIRLLTNRYIDPIDTNRITWRLFEDEIDRVFTVKMLEKTPHVKFAAPPKHIKERPRKGTMNWQDASKTMRGLAEDALARIQTRIRQRRIHLHPFFRDYDKLNSGHVRCNQANQVLRTNGILLSPDELNSIYARYGNAIGFNYAKFMEDADPAEYGLPALVPHPESQKAGCPAIGAVVSSKQYTEEYIIKLLSSIKRQTITRSIRVLDFLQDFDRHREGDILDSDFRRGVYNSTVKITEDEMDALCTIFRSPKRGCCVLYRDFCRALEEIFVEIETSMGDEKIYALPVMHLANLDCLDCFLNFEERALCSQALMKLALKPDEISNLKQVFEDFDRENCGTVRRNQLVRALTARDMLVMVSSRELDAICKCYGVTRGLQLEFNYRDFLKGLDIIFRTGQARRTY